MGAVAKPGPGQHQTLARGKYRKPLPARRAAAAGVQGMTEAPSPGESPSKPRMLWARAGGRAVPGNELHTRELRGPGPRLASRTEAPGEQALCLTHDDGCGDHGVDMTKIIPESPGRASLYLVLAVPATSLGGHCCHVGLL